MMDQRIMQFVERLFQGRTDESMDKHEILGKAKAMGMPKSVLGHLDTLPPGRLSRDEVTRHVAGTQGTSLEQDILGGLEGSGRKAA
jgi:hypothetical protein